MQRPAVLLLVGCLLLGCSGEAADRSAPAPTPSPPTSSETAPEPAAKPAVRTTTRKGTVTGRIGRGDRKDVVRRVSRVVDGWLGAAAYVGGRYPRKDTSFGRKAWPGFTVGALRTARADRTLTSNADIAQRIDAVTVKRREITVDVLATAGTARAATARVRLTFKTTGLDRKVSVTGRVFLTKKNGRWRVFGYDLAKARV